MLRLMGSVAVNSYAPMPSFVADEARISVPVPSI